LEASEQAVGGMMFDLTAHIERQKAFSEKTFGPGARTKGVCDHIRKEIVEVTRSPKDIMEWIDILILAIDGAWRAGNEPKEIAESIGYEARGVTEDIIKHILDGLIHCERGNKIWWLDIANLASIALLRQNWPKEAIWYAMLAKQIKNESRNWPDWRDQPEDKAIEHIR
jgi:hypothetical protein